MYSRSDLSAAFSTFISENFRLAPLQGDVHAMRHLPIPEQGGYLRLVVNDFFNYYAVPTNARALNAFYYHLLSTRCAACGGEASGIG
jgi:hypothetical protein